MPAIRDEYAARKHALQVAATALLVAADQVLSDLDHDRIPAVDGVDVIRAAAEVAVQAELLREAAGARMAAA